MGPGMPGHGGRTVRLMGVPRRREAPDVAGTAVRIMAFPLLVGLAFARGLTERPKPDARRAAGR